MLRNMRIPLWLVALGCALVSSVVAAGKPNVLIITVDDMSADSLGAFGCKLPDTSPTIDRLAMQGMRFNRAHVVVGNCFPSRNVMWSGLYPHNTGVEGFYQVRDAKHLHLADLMKKAGYYTGIFHKVSHSTPYSPYPAWDADLTDNPAGGKRDTKAAKSYSAAAAQGIKAARDGGKPFCLVLNVADPHKPFYAEGRGGQTVPDANVPSRCSSRRRCRFRVSYSTIRWCARSSRITTRACGARMTALRPFSANLMPRGSVTIRSSSSSPTTACRCPSPRRRFIITARTRRCSGSCPV
jgi:hypothetical protein